MNGDDYFATSSSPHLRIFAIAERPLSECRARQYALDPDLRVREALAMHADCPAAIANELVRTRAVGLRLAASDSLPDATLSAIGRHGTRALIKELLRCQPDIPATVLAMIERRWGSDSAVAHLLITQSQLPADAWRHIYRRHQPALISMMMERMLAQPAMPSDLRELVLERLLSTDRATQDAMLPLLLAWLDEDHLRELLEHPSVAQDLVCKGIAMNPAVSEGLVTNALAVTSAAGFIRSALLAHERAPVDLVATELTRDPHNALVTGRTPHAGPLGALAHRICSAHYPPFHEPTEVAHLLAANPATPVAALQQLALHERSEIAMTVLYASLHAPTATRFAALAATRRSLHHRFGETLWRQFARAVATAPVAHVAFGLAHEALTLGAGYIDELVSAALGLPDCPPSLLRVAAQRRPTHGSVVAMHHNCPPRLLLDLLDGPTLLRAVVHPKLPVADAVRLATEKIATAPAVAEYLLRERPETVLTAPLRTLLAAHPAISELALDSCLLRSPLALTRDDPVWHRLLQAPADSLHPLIAAQRLDLPPWVAHALLTRAPIYELLEQLVLQQLDTRTLTAALGAAAPAARERLRRALVVNGAWRIPSRLETLEPSGQIDLLRFVRGLAGTTQREAACATQAQALMGLLAHSTVPMAPALARLLAV